jgi:DNA (cytosine-5)-methyltransferase 1
MEKGSPEQSDGTCIQSNDAHTSSQGLQGSEHFGSIREERKESTDEQFIRQFCNQWEEFPTQSSVCTGNDGFPTKLDGITFPKWRNESIKAAGNAIVPQVALQIFKSIEQYESF